MKVNFKPTLPIIVTKNSINNNTGKDTKHLLKSLKNPVVKQFLLSA